MSLADWHRHHGDVHRLLSAYAGEEADDAPGSPGRALTAFLRQTTPSVAATTAARLRETVAEGPDPAMPWPVPAGPAGLDEWLTTVADLLDAAVDDGFPPPADPVTHWEWNARFPELGQLLGCYYSQDFPDEFASHDAALTSWLATAGRRARARLAGEIHELLAVDIETPVLLEGLTELGLEVDPPAAPERWLADIATRVDPPLR